MSDHINESDWMIFRELHAVAMERGFAKAIAAIERKLGGKKDNRERFWDVVESVKKQEKHITGLFDDLRRSTAVIMIARIRHEGFLSDEEISRFSQETQDKVRTILELSKN